MNPTLRLYRPVGLKELQLVLETNSRAFPPRLPGQPIFYPVMNEGYAVQIARDWNPTDEASGYAGFVTEFEVDAEFLSQFPVQTVGASNHQELWIPAERLGEFNAHLRGVIRVTQAFFGANFIGPRDLSALLTQRHEARP